MLTEQRVKIFRWDALRARLGEPLEVLRDAPVSLPAAHDDARREAQAHVEGLTRGRVRGCSALVGGGFSVIVELPEG